MNHKVDGHGRNMLKVAEELAVVPMSAIRAICGPHGRHFRPKPKDWWTGVCEYPRQRRDRDEYERRRIRAHSYVISIDDAVSEGNLDHEDYRFWIGCHEPRAMYSVCRFCRVPCWNETMRKTHQSRSNCCANLTVIYKMLLQRNACVVCGEPKERNPWGVPLCKTIGCLSTWKFDQVTKCGPFERAKHDAMAKNMLRAPLKDIE
jgi:hypothetical protein